MPRNALRRGPALLHCSMGIIAPRRPMRVRPIISAGLAVALLSLSAWSGACELSCWLPRCGAFHAAQVTAPLAARAMGMSHSHCGDAAKARTTAASSGAALKAASCCRTVPCGQATILTSPVREHRPAQSMRVQAAVAEFGSTIAPNPYAPTPESSHSPPGSPQVDPLAISLRI